MLRFETMLAVRHLRYSPGQTGLTIGTVAIAVTVMIFINSLILGLQQRILRDQIGALPHITVKMPDLKPTALAALASPQPGRMYVSRLETQAQQRLDIEQPELLEEQLRQFPGVRVAVASRLRSPWTRPTKRQPPPSGMLPNFVTSTWISDPG